MPLAASKLRTPRRHYSHLSQAVFCSVHFQGDRAVLGISTAATVTVQIILEGVEILPTEDPYRFPRWALDSLER